ncbi:6-phosphofructokinase [candidate division NPL-UPA2 bacterium]|nr:6-phosphofructokinase [candidate division NPL-UPA2 bacterium]
MTEKLKGKVLVGQSGGPTVVINQSLVGIVSEALRHEEITGVYGAKYAIEGILREDFFDLGQEEVANLEKVAATPCAALGSARKKPTEEECHKVLEIFKKYNIRYFFYIGGNDSAETANIVADIASAQDYEMRLFHVPKTIDNDLLITDHCPGYGTAAKFVALAIMGDNLDNLSIPGIKINVIMGRHAGFLTAASSLAREYENDAPHLIYLPESPFSEDRFLADVEDIYSRLGRVVIAVSEGISREGGEPLYATGEVDSHGNVQLSGTGALGDFLTGLIKKEIKTRGKLRVRSDTFGYLQRSFPGIVSKVDAREARLVGKEALKLALSQEDNGSIALRRLGEGRDYRVETFITPLSSVARKTKSMPSEFIAESGNDITEAFTTYARPLVGSLPEIGRLTGVKVLKE